MNRHARRQQIFPTVKPGDNRIPTGGACATFFPVSRSGHRGPPPAGPGDLHLGPRPILDMQRQDRPTGWHPCKIAIFQIGIMTRGLGALPVWKTSRNLVQARRRPCQSAGRGNRALSLRLFTGPGVSSRSSSPLIFKTVRTMPAATDKVPAGDALEIGACGNGRSCRSNRSTIQGSQADELLTLPLSAGCAGFGSGMWVRRLTLHRY